jgi:hypothetical protein
LEKSFPISAHCGTGYASVSVHIALLLGVLMVQIWTVVYARTFRIRGVQRFDALMNGTIPLPRGSDQLRSKEKVVDCIGMINCIEELETIS